MVVAECRQYFRTDNYRSEDDKITFNPSETRDWLDEYLPFSIYICGNDDCSYTRYFSTHEEVDIELNYLRKMQPLDFYKDIRDRQYHFTN